VHVWKERTLERNASAIIVLFSMKLQSIVTAVILAAVLQRILVREDRQDTSSFMHNQVFHITSFFAPVFFRRVIERGAN